jgi:hypothetical protein
MRAMSRATLGFSAIQTIIISLILDAKVIKKSEKWNFFIFFAPAHH